MFIASKSLELQLNQRRWPYIEQIPMYLGQNNQHASEILTQMLILIDDAPPPVHLTSSQDPIVS